MGSDMTGTSGESQVSSDPARQIRRQVTGNMRAEDGGARDLELAAPGRSLAIAGLDTGADQVSPKGAMDAARVLITAADRCSHPGPGRYYRRG
jgi:hypothetical protein